MICTACKQDKVETEFSFKNKNLDKLSTICKKCKRTYNKFHYKNNLSSYKLNANTNTKKYRIRNLLYVWDYLTNNPCKDCSENNPIVLDFDHLEGFEKYKNISRMVNNGCSLSSIKKEIEKCEVRCANCHRIKTAKQFGFYQYIKL